LEDNTSRVLSDMVSFRQLFESKEIVTNGAGGRLYGSTSWGMVPQISTHWFSRSLLAYAVVHDWNRRRAAKATLKTETAMGEV
jgi:hypothetical protein